MEAVRNGLRVLVVDDEREMATLISRSLSDDGYEVDTAADGIQALGMAEADHFDLAVVDVTMPGMSGFELCRRLRERSDGMGIMLLTARDAVDDRVRGLDSGADDYLTKPFAFAELRARLRALRRRADAGMIRVEVGNVVLNAHRYRASVNGKDVPFSRTEFDVLRLLAANAGAVVARTQLMEDIWGSTQYQSNIVDQYVSYTRRKLQAAGATVRIVTERGVGFTLTADS